MRKALLMLSTVMLVSQNGLSEPVPNVQPSDSEINSEIRNKAYVYLGISILALAASIPLGIISTNRFVKRDSENFNKIQGGIGLCVSVPLGMSGFALLVSSFQLFSSSKAPLEVKEVQNIGN
jgi:hypothetical protein